MGRRDGLGKIPHLAEQRIRVSAEVEGMAEDLDAGPMDYVAGWFLVAFGIEEVTFAQSENGAVGQELV
jgi:hypothetical protein